MQLGCNLGAIRGHPPHARRRVGIADDLIHREPTARQLRRNQGMLMTSFIASPRQSGDFMSEKDVSAMMT